MTTYKYSAVDKNGKSINGSIEAESEQKAAEQLKKEGNTVDFLWNTYGK